MSSGGVSVLWRPQAERDLVEAVPWLREHASVDVALELVDAIEGAVDLLVRHPLAGSGWVGTRLGIAELRSFPVSGTRYILFHLVTERGLEVVRVLHGSRDIVAELIAP